MEPFTVHIKPRVSGPGVGAGRPGGTRMILLEVVKVEVS